MKLDQFSNVYMLNLRGDAILIPESFYPDLEDIWDVNHNICLVYEYEDSRIIEFLISDYNEGWYLAISEFLKSNLSYLDYSIYTAHHSEADFCCLMGIKYETFIDSKNKDEFTSLFTEPVLINDWKSEDEEE